MNGRPRRAAIVLACCFAEILTAHAQGGSPMITDDPGTPGNGQWEINAAYLEERAAVARDRSFPHILSGGDLIVNVGLRQQLVGHLKLIAAAGTGLRNGADTTQFVGCLGFQFFTRQ
jgi:hypothetical protein